MHTLNIPTGGYSRPTQGKTLRKWVTLIFGLVMVALGVYLYIVGLTKIPGGQAHLDLLREGDYRAGAYFYSDVEQVRTAELYLNDSKNYAPRQK